LTTPQLPTGTVTLLLADIEGSTGLWETDPTAMRNAVDHFERVVSETISANGGLRPVEQGEGDSFVAAFSRAADAVACALALQLVDLGPIRLRIGLHTGEVQLRDAGNYIGLTVNRCARIRDLGHGGQTLLSAATYDFVADRLTEGAWCADLGLHRLRDLARPEQTFQLCHPDLDNEFPPLRSLDSYQHNLPVQLTTFVGRTAELAEVCDLLTEARLVTLTGSGGAGKTRLAIQIGADTLADHPDGVWLIELAPVADPDLVPIAVARGLGLRDEPIRSTTETIVHYLNGRRTLIILDNCEQVVAACAELGEVLLRSCASTHLLVTSREPLGVGGEVTWRVPSLSLPSKSRRQVLENVHASEAVQLFSERASRSLPGFAVTEANAAAVVDICQRLDGIPLAIELAAARVRVLSPDQIAAGLADRFQLLTGGGRTAVPRQQTLRASVDWSHDLLTEPERIVFRHLACCVGGFDFEGARAVASGDGVESHNVLDQLALLVDKSLVVADAAGDSIRYRLLETVRHYAYDRLVESGEEIDALRRHRDHFLAVAEQAAAGVRSPEQDKWIAHLEREIDNLRSAFEWSCERGDIDEALRLACSLGYVWVWRGRYAEGREWLDAGLSRVVDVGHTVHVRALALRGQVEGAAFGLSLGWSEQAIQLARADGNPALLAETLAAAAMTTAYWGDLADAWCREAIELTRRIDDQWNLAQALTALGILLVLSGRPVEARSVFDESEPVARQQGHRFAFLLNATLSSMALIMQGDLDEACRLSRAAADEARAAGDRTTELSALCGNAWALAEAGQRELAMTVAQDALVVAREFGMPPLEGLPRLFHAVAAIANGEAELAASEAAEAWALAGGMIGATDLGLVIWAEAALSLGDVATAQARAAEALERTAALPDNWFHARALTVDARLALSDCNFDRARDSILAAVAIGQRASDRARGAEGLEILAAIAAATDEPANAVRMLASASAVRTRTGYARFDIYREDLERLVDELRSQLGEASYAEVWAEGALLPLDDAYALTAVAASSRNRPSIGWDSLTPAERDVVRLVADGLPNKDIAERLSISPRTVQAHLTHVYSKLDVSSRVQLANEAARRL